VESHSCAQNAQEWGTDADVLVLEITGKFKIKGSGQGCPLYIGSPRHTLVLREGLPAAAVFEATVLGSFGSTQSPASPPIVFRSRWQSL